MDQEALQEAEVKMKDSLRALEEDLSGIRTGRATPSLVDRLQVDYYGSLTPLMQIATISAPEPTMLTIRPYDASSIDAIMKAIQISGLGLTPDSDGSLVRLVLPPLTKERRAELVKVVGNRIEQAKVSIRNTRRDAMDDLKEFEKEGLISEDEMHRSRGALQKLTDRYVEQVDEAGARKEKEILDR